MILSSPFQRAVFAGPIFGWPAVARADLMGGAKRLLAGEAESRLRGEVGLFDPCDRWMD